MQTMLNDMPSSFLVSYVLNLIFKIYFYELELCVYEKERLIYTLMTCPPKKGQKCLQREEVDASRTSHV